MRTVVGMAAARPVVVMVAGTRLCLKRGLTLSGQVLLLGILHALQRVRPLLRQSLTGRMSRNRV